MTFTMHTIGGFLGRMHPAVVHFPIALLAVAALLEAIQILRRKATASSSTLLLSSLAAVGAVAASCLGLLLQQFEGQEGRLLDLHRSLGWGTTAAALTSSFLLARGRSRPVALWGGRAALGIGTTLVLGAGFLGGELVFGPNHLLAVFSPPPAAIRTGPGSAARVDFEREIAPLFRAFCLKCHGPGRQKGRLRLDAGEFVERGGESGPCVIPGHRLESRLYVLLLEPDPDIRMPQGIAPLLPAQIERIGRWIDQGAPWSDEETIR